MYFFLPPFCPFCFSSFCLFPIFFCFVSDSGVFLPALLAVLFFLFQKIFSFSFPAFCRTSFRNSCLHPPSALTRPVRPALQILYRLFFTFRLHRPFSAKAIPSEIPSFRSLQPLSLANITVSPKTDLPENLSRLRVVFPADLLLHLYFLSLSRCFLFLISHVPFFLLYCKIANYFFLRFPFSLFFPSSLVVRKNYPVHNAFTWPLPSFLLLVCFICFPQRPSCPKFRLRGLYNLCPTPTSPSARKPTCPRTCLDSAPFFLPTFCSFSIFCRFRVVFGF